MFEGDPVMEEGDREAQRLEALERYDVLDTPREESFDRITRLVRRTFQVPIANISMVDAHRQWFKSAEGFTAHEVPLNQTICQHAIKAGQPLIIPDTDADPRFADHPGVRGEPYVRFYAGVPLTTRDGDSIGMLCAIDTKPREFSPEDVSTMSDLAQVVLDELELRRLVSTDPLTGLMSRRAFKENAARAVSLALRHHHDLSCIEIDLDGFKQLNDRYGHPAGDAVLKGMAEACQAELRGSDLMGRLGGEEFAVLLPHTGPGPALEVAERLRLAIAERSFETAEEPVKVTASLGLASLGPGTNDLDRLLQRADEALYQAKAAGRNRTVAAPPPAVKLEDSRRRVLKGGRILFNGRQSSIDCTVRSLSETGAGIDISSVVGIPKTFELSIPKDRFEKTCRTLSSTEKHLEVEFC